MSKPLAISYIRFSTSAQAMGDSFRRQYEKTVAYCEANGLRLADAKFHDLGISGFTGANRRDGMLGKLIEEIEKGTIPKGSYLIVESLDRLSRDKVLSQFGLFSKILQDGIVIVTLFDGRVYSKDSVENSPMELMLALVTMMRANDESETKSKRGRASWESKRKKAAEGLAITAVVPHWLKKEGEKLVVREDRAKIVRDIFEWTISGLGRRSIAKKLNGANIPVWGQKRNKSGLWGDSYIIKILKNPAVTGEFQPMLKQGGKRIASDITLSNYYPRVISDDVFYLAQAKLQARQGRGGRNAPKASNLFGTLARCACCGGGMRYTKKAENEEYLQCTASNLNSPACQAPRVNYLALERFFVSSLTGSQWVQILSKPQQDSSNVLVAKQAALADIERKTVNLLVLGEDAPDNPTLKKRLGDLDREAKRLAIEIESLKVESAKEKDAPDAQEVAMFAQFFAADNLEHRRKLKEILENEFSEIFIGRPEVGKVGVAAVLKGGKILLGQQSATDRKARREMVLAPWQLRTEAKRKTLQYSLVADKQEVMRPMPTLVTLPKDADPLTEFVCPQALALLDSRGLMPKGTPKFKELNEKEIATYKEQLDAFGAFDPAMEVIGAEGNSEGAIFGDSSEWRDIASSRELVEMSFNQRMK